MLIEARNLSFSYGKEEVFKGLNFAINESFKAVICGENGSGKSTFLSILAGLLNPSVGEVVRRRNLKIAYLFQNSFDQFIAPSVLEDVAFSLLADKVGAKDAKKQALNMLELLEISHLANRSIYYLSGGEKRLVAIAGVLVRNADIYLLDEPFNELDDNKSKLALKGLYATNKPFVIITHHKKDILNQNEQRYIFTKNEILRG
ncbi:energy-coupling factor ABC transporter ATP-binding protein [Campylobacter sp.]|uniref:energy-coupling factor ABC transporter ATP-binding protein n=1 Tax=Campylobacter sp. TaxID=205 RepID=UPI0027090C02|nr:ABC transporter ATP-binding protein [Campylobacter sp.]